MISFLCSERAQMSKGRGCVPSHDTKLELRASATEERETLRVCDTLLKSIIGKTKLEHLINH